MLSRNKLRRPARPQGLNRAQQTAEERRREAAGCWEPGGGASAPAGAGHPDYRASRCPERGVGYEGGGEAPAAPPQATGLFPHHLIHKRWLSHVNPGRKETIPRHINTFKKKSKF